MTGGYGSTQPNCHNPRAGDLGGSASGRQSASHRLWVTSDHPQIGLGGRVGGVAVLFPIPQRANWDVELFRELLLRQAERPADDLHLRRPLHAQKVGVGQGAIFGIKHGLAHDKRAFHLVRPFEPR